MFLNTISSHKHPTISFLCATCTTSNSDDKRSINVFTAGSTTAVHSANQTIFTVTVNTSTIQAFAQVLIVRGSPKTATSTTN